MYYGINAKSHNMIMLDRKQARCPNGLKLGTPCLLYTSRCV